MALVVIGLCLFEVIVSIDNAIINAEVLSKMSPKARKWFLFWGILFAVFAIRGLLPWLIVWLATPGLGPIEAFTAAFSSDPSVLTAVEASAPLLLMGGGVFLLFLFLHWLFLEEKHFGLPAEKFIARNGLWFFAVVSIVLATIVWFALKISNMVAFAAVIGSSAFFIVHGFKENAESSEKALINGTSQKSDLAKVFYLIIIDATFSIDGVIGAFAFTMIVPLILVGNGLGALVVREITIRNITSINKYKYLKNGAMYSIFFLGGIMIYDAFGHHIPFYVSPLITISAVGFFFLKSKFELEKEEKHIKKNKQ